MTPGIRLRLLPGRFNSRTHCNNPGIRSCCHLCCWNCLSTKEAGEKTLECDWGGKTKNSFPCPLASSKEPKGYENSLFFTSAFYMEYNACHCSQNPGSKEVLVYMKATRKKVNGDWENQSMVLSPVLAHLPYIHETWYIYHIYGITPGSVLFLLYQNLPISSFSSNAPSSRKQQVMSVIDPYTSWSFLTHITEMVNMWFAQPYPASLHPWQSSHLRSKIKAQDYWAWNWTQSPSYHSTQVSLKQLIDDVASDELCLLSLMSMLQASGQPLIILNCNSDLIVPSSQNTMVCNKIRMDVLGKINSP